MSDQYDEASVDPTVTRYEGDYRALVDIVNMTRYEDHDGPCWCYLRNAGPYEGLGHSAQCKALKAHFGD